MVLSTPTSIVRRAGAWLLAALLVLTLWPGLPHAEKVKVAVMELEGLGPSSEELAALSDRLRESLLATGRFVLIDRSQLKAVLDEQALQQAVCEGEACAAHLGELLGAKRIIGGKVVKLEGRIWLVTALMVDVETSETVDLASVRHDGNLLGLLDREMPELARYLAGIRSGTAAPAPSHEEASPQNTDQPLKLAVFPSLLAGKNADRLREGHGPLVTQIGRIARAEKRLDLYATVYRSQEFTEAYERLAAAVDVDTLKRTAWEGRLLKTPNEQVVYETGRKLGVDLVFMQRSYHNPERRGGRSYHAYLFDVNRLEMLTESGTWGPKKWRPTLRGAFKRLMLRYDTRH